MALYFIIGGLTVSVIAILLAYINFEYAKSWRKSLVHPTVQQFGQLPANLYPKGHHLREFILKLICWAGILSAVGGFIAYFLK